MAPELVDMGRTSRKELHNLTSPLFSTLVNGPRAWKTRLAGSSCNREGQTGAQLFRRVFKPTAPCRYSLEMTIARLLRIDAY